MKKLLLVLLVFVSLISCSPKVYYFSRETDCPQCVVDSLLGPNTSNYLEWESFTVKGVNQGDSTIISTYVLVQQYQTVSVTDFENESESLVKEQRRGKAK